MTLYQNISDLQEFHNEAGGVVEQDSLSRMLTSGTVVSRPSRMHKKPLPIMARLRSKGEGGSNSSPALAISPKQPGSFLLSNA